MLYIFASDAAQIRVRSRTKIPGELAFRFDCSGWIKALCVWNAECAVQNPIDQVAVMGGKDLGRPVCQVG